MRHDVGDDDEVGGIDLTPMLDVVFLLLIFFLAATTFAREEVELDLRLPPAKTGQTGKGDTQVVINLMADGRIQIDGREVTLEALRQKLTAAAARNPEQSVLVRGDQKAQFGIGIEVLDACRLAKLKKLDFGAVPGKGN